MCSSDLIGHEGGIVIAHHSYAVTALRFREKGDDDADGTADTERHRSVRRTSDN